MMITGGLDVERARAEVGERLERAHYRALVAEARRAATGGRRLGPAGLLVAAAAGGLRAASALLARAADGLEVRLAAGSAGAAGEHRFRLGAGG